jgi:hypothetical protein
VEGAEVLMGVSGGVSAGVTVWVWVVEGVLVVSWVTAGVGRSDSSVRREI